MRLVGAVRLVTGVGQAALNRLQTECAAPLTRLARETLSSQTSRAIGALQSALEVALGLDERRAGAVAAVVIHGSREHSDGVLTLNSNGSVGIATASSPPTLSGRAATVITLGIPPVCRCSYPHWCGWRGMALLQPLCANPT